MAPEVVASRRSARALKRDQHALDFIGRVLIPAAPDRDFVSGQTPNVHGGMHMD